MDTGGEVWRLRGGEIRGEGGVDFVATSEGAVNDADTIDLGLDALDAIGLAVDILLENVADALAIDVEARDEFLTSTEGGAVVDGDTADHDVDALLVEVFEADAHTLDELMTGYLKVMLVVSVVDNSLDIAFVITRLQFELIGILFHFLINNRGWKMMEMVIMMPNPMG